jgi:bifunctional non-homologous end joining protein LigD
MLSNRLRRGAQRADGRVRLLIRKGINFASRFSLVVAALTVLPVRSCLIDGEAVVCNESGLAVFDLLRGYRHDAAAVLCAFDLLELDGKDLRRMPIEERKRILAKLLSHPHEGIAFNEHHTGDGATIFDHACARSAARASCRSVSARHIAPVPPIVG